MKKFFVRDADGEEYEVEEIKECHDEVVEWSKQIQFVKQYTASRHLNKDAFYFDGIDAVDDKTSRNIPGAKLGMERKKLEAALDKHFGVHDSVKDDDVIEEVSETEEQPEVLTKEEIAALKRLAAVADRLLSTVKAEDEDPETLDDEDEEKDIADEEVTEEKKEEVVDTTKTRDSRKSFGAIEKRKATVDDSLNTDIDNAWAKRYGGRN